MNRQSVNLLLGLVAGALISAIAGLFLAPLIFAVLSKAVRPSELILSQSFQAGDFTIAIVGFFVTTYGLAIAATWLSLKGAASAAARKFAVVAVAFISMLLMSFAIAHVRLGLIVSSLAISNPNTTSGLIGTSIELRALVEPLLSWAVGTVFCIAFLWRLADALRRRRRQS
jgi:hypothetical protein